VYARAFVLAVLGGPRGKPRYVVTRKEHQHALHWRQIAPHVILLGLLAGSMAWSLAHHSVLSSFDVGTAYWAVLYSLLLAGFVRLSWHGVPFSRRTRRDAQTRESSEPQPVKRHRESPAIPLGVATPPLLEAGLRLSSPPARAAEAGLLVSLNQSSEPPRAMLSEGKPLRGPGRAGV
jgi:hypothetical protein